MIQEKPGTQASAPRRDGPGMRRPGGACPIPGAGRRREADGRQGKSRTGSSRSCWIRVSRSGRKLGRPACEPGWATDSAFHHAAETWGE